MKCDISIELLSGYLDGELDEKQKAVVEKHLRECQSCQNELEELKLLNEYIKVQEIEEPSREFFFGVNRRVMEKIIKKPRSFVMRWTPIFAPVAVALLVLVVVINTIPQKRFVGIDSRILYAEIKHEEEVELRKAKVYAPRAPVAKEKISEEGKGALAAPEILAISEAAKKPKVVDEAVITDLEVSMDQLAIPRDRVIRAIVDSTGRVLKVATGNTIVPEKDTMLENRLEGQQLSPPTIAGRKTQVYVDLTPTKENDH